KLADGMRFDVVPGGNDARLSAAGVAAFGFTTSVPAGAQFNGAQLSVPAGAGLQVIAGDITADGTGLSAPSGTLRLLSAGPAGELKITAKGHLNLLGGGQISTDTFDTGKAGSVTVYAQDITISGATPDNATSSAVLADSHSSGQSSDVKVTAKGQLNILGG